MRCAHLSLQQGLQDRNPVEQLIARSAWEAKRAVAEVEQGQLEDHPKHAALAKLLKQTDTLIPVGMPDLYKQSTAGFGFLSFSGNKQMCGSG